MPEVPRTSSEIVAALLDSAGQFRRGCEADLADLNAPIRVLDSATRETGSQHLQRVIEATHELEQSLSRKAGN